MCKPNDLNNCIEEEEEEEEYEEETIVSLIQIHELLSVTYRWCSYRYTECSAVGVEKEFGIIWEVTHRFTER
jgi:hypothetical protein